MLPKTDGEYQKLLTDVIKKQIIVLGPDITLAKARNVPGLTVADDGTVTSFSGDPQTLTQKLIEQFMELSGQIVKKTMEPLLASYPGFMPQSAQKTESAQSAQPAQPQPQPVQPQPTTPQPDQQPQVNPSDTTNMPNGVKT